MEDNLPTPDEITPPAPIEPKGQNHWPVILIGLVVMIGAAAGAFYLGRQVKPTPTKVVDQPQGAITEKVTGRSVPTGGNLVFSLNWLIPGPGGAAEGGTDNLAIYGYSPNTGESWELYSQQKPFGNELGASFAERLDTKSLVVHRRTTDGEDNLVLDVGGNKLDSRVPLSGSLSESVTSKDEKYRAYPDGEYTKLVVEDLTTGNKEDFNTQGVADFGYLAPIGFSPDDSTVYLRTACQCDAPMGFKIYTLSRSSKKVDPVKVIIDRDWIGGALDANKKIALGVDYDWKGLGPGAGPSKIEMVDFSKGITKLLESSKDEVFGSVNLSPAGDAFVYTMYKPPVKDPQEFYNTRLYYSTLAKPSESTLLMENTGGIWSWSKDGKYLIFSTIKLLGGDSNSGYQTQSDLTLYDLTAKKATVVPVNYTQIMPSYFGARPAPQVVGWFE